MKLNNIKFFNVFVVYINNNSLKFLNNHCKINYTICFESFIDLLNESEKKSYNTTINKYPIYKNFNDNYNICNIYFDHKLADFTSIFQPLYAYGLMLNENPTDSLTEKVLYKSIGSFINGCEEFYKINKYQTINDLQDLYPTICPSAFYKQIKYTLNNKNINNIKMII